MWLSAENSPTGQFFIFAGHSSSLCALPNKSVTPSLLVIDGEPCHLIVGDINNKVNQFNLEDIMLASLITFERAEQRLLSRLSQIGVIKATYRCEHIPWGIIIGAYLFIFV